MHEAGGRSFVDGLRDVRTMVRPPVCAFCDAGASMATISTTAEEPSYPHNQHLTSGLTSEGSAIRVVDVRAPRVSISNNLDI